MNSSIFNFEHVARYGALPRREKCRHVASVALLAAAMLIALRVPEWIYGRYGCRRRTFRTAAVAALSARTRVLGVGSSHVLGGLRPDRFTAPAMNLASPGLNYVAAEAVLRVQLPRVPRLQVAILEWDDVPLTADTMLALGRDYRSLLELGLTAQQLPTRTAWQRLRVLADATLYPVVNLPRITPLALQSESSSSCSSENGARCASAGYAPQVRTLKRDEYTPGLLAKALTSMAADREMTRLNSEALTRIVDMLRARGVTVVLLQLPHHELYWQSEPALLRDTFASTERMLRARYGRDPRVQFWKWGRRTDFRDSDYADGDHLNPRGADRLSRLVDGRLRPLLATGAADGRLASAVAR